MTELFKKDKIEKTETSNARENGSGLSVSKMFGFSKKNKRGGIDHTKHTTLLSPTESRMKRLLKKNKKEKTETSNAHEYGSGLMENILNEPYRRPHRTLPSSTSTAPGQMQAVSSPSSSASKLVVNDVMVSGLASNFTQMQVGHSGSGPSASTLGQAMATTNPTALEHKPSLISAGEKNLLERLKFSYDNLENQVERDCFLFCCMYPENREIDKNTLVGCWIGEGLLDIGNGTYEETWNRGHGIIDTLVAKSLLEVMQLSSMMVKMHHVIRDMGLRIGSESNYFVHTASLRLSREEISKRWNKARWIYVEDHNGDIPRELDCPNLSSLHIRCATDGLNVVEIMNSMNFKCKVKVLIMEFLWIPCSPFPTFEHFVGLRHLEIKDSNMIELPSDIGKLTKLLVLILLHNNNLTTLPPTIGDICELRKIQIRQCDRLENIPSGLGKLKKLEMVDISAPLVVYKGNIFKDCSELRMLHLEVETPTVLLIDLLKNLKKLEELCIKIIRPENGTFLIEGLKRLTSLTVLKMDGWPIADGDEMILAIGAMCQLRELRIIRCSIEKLVIPATTDFLPQLEVLEIYACNQLQKVHLRKRALQSLRILKIGYCKCLAHVVGVQHLPQLRELTIYDLEDFREGLITTTDDDGHCFPNLQRLRLESLRQMKHMCKDNVSFPSLSEFRLDDCPMLEKLPRGLMNESRSTTMMSGEIVGTEEWWEGLEWEDDDAFKAYLRPLFVAVDQHGWVINRRP